MKILTMNFFRLLLIITIVLAGCNDNNNEGNEYNPNIPVEITDFSPKEGAARTRLYINGKNFGTDISKIQVKIGGINAKVIGCSGDIIYCMVPFKADEGTIEVAVDNSPAVVASEKFNYIQQSMVTTLCGKVAEDGTVEVKDGAFEECGFVRPEKITIDPKNPSELYVVDNQATIRKIDIKTRTVSTLINRGQAGWYSIKDVFFSLTGDTMFVANDRDLPDAIGLSFMTRENGFKKPQTYMTERRFNRCSLHPNGEIYYSSAYDGAIHRYDPITQEKRLLFNVADKGKVSIPSCHPDGGFAYIILYHQQAIYKSIYDNENKVLTTPSSFAGTKNKAGWVDGMQTNAKLNNPQMGVFVKNDEYVKEGKSDVYDYYFCDQLNHCIRVLTPEGNIYTFAGRGSQGANKDPFGYVDGDLLKEARFNQPIAITYDSVNKIFYIADAINKRIRSIVIDE